MNKLHVMYNKELLKHPEVVQILNDAVMMFNHKKYTKAIIINFINTSMTDSGIARSLCNVVSSKLRSITRETASRDVLMNCVIALADEISLSIDERTDYIECIKSIVEDPELRQSVVNSGIIDIQQLTRKIGKTIPEFGSKYYLDNSKLYRDVCSILYNSNDYFNLSIPEHMVIKLMYYLYPELSEPMLTLTDSGRFVFGFKDNI